MCKNGYICTIFAGDLAIDKPFRRVQETRIIPGTVGEIHAWKVKVRVKVCIY
jgi:hypothetical protein